MDNILFTVFKFILGLKFGWVIIIVVGSVFALSLVRNIIAGSFSVTKFASGFNPFTGSVQGKLIYYGILAILAFGLYHQLTRATEETNYDTDYRNNIHHNADVIVDQRVGPGCTPTKILWGLIQFGCNSQAVSKNVVIDQRQAPTTSKIVNER